MYRITLHSVITDYDESNSRIFPEVLTTDRLSGSAALAVYLHTNA